MPAAFHFPGRQSVWHKACLDPPLLFGAVVVSDAALVGAELVLAVSARASVMAKDPAMTKAPPATNSLFIPTPGNTRHTMSRNGGVILDQPASRCNKGCHDGAAGVGVVTRRFGA